MTAWREAGERDGHTVTESIVAIAQPAGPTVRAVYESLRDELLADLQRAMPVDVILLYLHGAMVADGYPDCEGDVLQRARTIAGEKAVIGAELDLHSHLTPTMLANANAIIAYKEYPHTDIVDRARDLYRICLDAAQRKALQVVLAGGRGAAKGNQQLAFSNYVCVQQLGIGDHFGLSNLLFDNQPSFALISNGCEW